MAEGACPGAACLSRCPTVVAMRRTWYALWQLRRSLHARNGRARFLAVQAQHAATTPKRQQRWRRAPHGAACSTAMSYGLRRRGAQGTGCQRVVGGGLLSRWAGSDGTGPWFMRRCAAKTGETTVDWGKWWALTARPHVAVRGKGREWDAGMWAAAPWVSR
jgi:hypothetical protein